MVATAAEVITHYRYRVPGTDQVIGVHEAARRAGEMLTARGDTVQGALLTAEYHAAIATRDGLGELAKLIKEAVEGGRVSDAMAELAATCAVAVAANSTAARLQVYMGAFAPEYTRVHPDNVADLKARPSSVVEQTPAWSP
ncbi:MAG: hypothetical protein JWQ89_3119 [Devosia sp.]|uniref:hypothetical protein n=1 Tax=Devosia sp. TaxID=1871048 RepID=UPI002604680B|nr:hypothetical protein [Devosia sp.]MDB5541392.1 hypothetical protein [Devosia sp.]